MQFLFAYDLFFILRIIVSYPKKELHRSSRVQLSRRVHLLVWYIPGPERGVYIPTLEPMYVPWRYLDPLGVQGSPGFLIMMPSSVELGRQPLQPLLGGSWDLVTNY